MHLQALEHRAKGTFPRDTDGIVTSMLFYKDQIDRKMTFPQAIISTNLSDAGILPEVSTAP